MTYTHKHHWGPWRDTAITADAVTVTRDCTCGESQVDQVRAEWGVQTVEEARAALNVEEPPNISDEEFAEMFGVAVSDVGDELHDRGLLEDAEPPGPTEVEPGG